MQQTVIPPDEAIAPVKVQIAVANAYGITISDLRAGGREAKTAEARQIAMYLTHVVFEVSHADVGRGFGRNRSTALYAARRVEAMREDPLIDATLEALETALRDAEVAA